MKHKFLAIVAVLMLLTSLMAAAPAGQANGNFMPANPEKVLQLLIKQGVVSASTSLDQQEAAIYAYLQRKMKDGGPDRNYNPLARKQVESNEEFLNANSGSAVRGKKLGNTTSVPASSPQFKTLDGADKLLLIAVDFSNTSYSWQPVEGAARTAAGPLHNKIPVPNNDFDLWVKNFDTQHYEDMLFTPGGWTMPMDAPRYAGKHFGSMHDYYLQQSFGEYTVVGKAFGWFTVNKPEAYYGDDRPSSGNDNNGPGTTADLIADAVGVVNAQHAINWEEYDTNGDCIIDHPLFIHAGVDQSGGGGVEGDDAIWAHSSSVEQKVAEATTACPEGLYIYNYTIMPEDGGVGVFAHEFGHDLGLPDEYDTIYSGRGDSVAFWSLMSSGSWVGRPAQTQPSDISIWGRMALGWVTNNPDLPEAERNLARINISQLGKTPINLRLEQSERWGGNNTLSAIRVDLPPKLLVVNTPYSGSWEWFGGKDDQLDTTLVREVDLSNATSAQLSFATWYDIENEWDFGFVQVSTDQGAHWTSLKIDGMSNTIDSQGMPEIAANLPGFTGNSGGWLLKTADLSAYAGQTIWLQFRYMTDWGTNLAGFFVDDISVTANGTIMFLDGAETLDENWTAKGWTRDQGSSYKTQYYLMEWRNLKAMETPNHGASIVNFDNGLTNAYSYDPNAVNPDQPEYFSYNPGLLLWYRDMSYSDNWTGTHPGHGFLLVVDAHSQAMLRPPYLNSKLGYGVLPWHSRVQTYDSPFSLTKALDATLSYWGILRKNAGASAVPNFDDSKLYWDPKAPANSVITPNLGLLFRVLGQASDGSAVVIGLGLK
jgi:immune inhibitor A